MGLCHCELLDEPDKLGSLAQELVTCEETDLELANMCAVLQYRNKTEKITQKTQLS